MNIIFMHGKNYEYPSYRIEGSVLTIEDEQYDLVALQKDEQKIINVIKDDRFVANIIIPAAKYEEIESDEVDEDENPIYKRIKKPLDLESIDLNLWKLELNITNESEEI